MRLQEWQKQSMPHLRSSSVYVRSKLMAVAIAVTNLSLGNLHRVSAHRGKFDGWLEAAKRAAHGQTLPAEAPR